MIIIVTAEALERRGQVNWRRCTWRPSCVDCAYLKGSTNTQLECKRFQSSRLINHIIYSEANCRAKWKSVRKRLQVRIKTTEGKLYSAAQCGNCKPGIQHTVGYTCNLSKVVTCVGQYVNILWRIPSPMGMQIFRALTYSNAKKSPLVTMMSTMVR